MKTIHKFPLFGNSPIRVEIPEGARILTVQTQGGRPHLWAEIDPDAPRVTRTFEVFGTGHEIPEGMGISREYVGTYQLYDGALVFHVYEYTGV